MNLWRYLILNEVDEIKVLDSHFENLTLKKSVDFTLFAQSSPMISLLCLNVKVKPSVLLISYFLFDNFVFFVGLNMIKLKTTNFININHHILNISKHMVKVYFNLKNI